SLGGNAPSAPASTDVVPVSTHYELDLTVSFNISSPALKVTSTNFTATGGPPPLAYHTSSLRDDNNSLVIWGGGTSDGFVGQLTPDTVWVFYAKNKSWTTAKIPVGPKPRRHHTAVINSTDPSWFDVYGGVQDTATGFTSAAPVLQNSVWGCDTDAFTWANLTAGPGERYQHAAVMTPNGTMIVIGGLQQYIAAAANASAAVLAQALAPMNSIGMYNSKTGVWASMAATGASGSTPADRAGHTAVMTEDNKILVYGGYDENNQPLGDLFILDPLTLTWTKPNVTGTPPSSRFFHTANVVDGQMVIVGGSGSSNAARGDVAVLTTSKATNDAPPTYVWSGTFVPKGSEVRAPQPSPSPSQQGSHAMKKHVGFMGIVGAVVAALLVVAM
ncbi:hypothetical protein BC936DRAFT_136615, partial [Jimgerdemannia flammicorona]